jgi:dihydroorotate dehydrogenase
MDPARAHSLAMAGLGAMEHVAPMRALFRRPLDPRLAVRVMGLEFPSPIGLAGGFDKNGGRAAALAALGFGHLELGTVTALAQDANPSPNLFRLPLDRALVNRLGFPNQGAERVAARIARRKKRVSIPIGISIGKSRAVPLDPIDGAISDYLASFRAVKDVADFVVVNVSSPNTKDLRAMQAADVARALFEALVHENSRVPLLVKIAPDLTDAAIDDVCDAARDAGLAGVVATNTTISREGLRTPPDVLEAVGAGGLSGKPLFARALSVVSRVRARLGPDACVIGVGGIDSAESARAMMRAGADLVQLYTAFVYEGPSLPRRIADDLAAQFTEQRTSS